MRYFFSHRIQNTAVSLDAAETHRRLGTVSISKQSLKQIAGVVLHGQGRGGTAPRNRIQVGIGIGRIRAGSSLSQVQREFEGCELRMLPQFLRRDLVNRDSR